MILFTLVAGVVQTSAFITLDDWSFDLATIWAIGSLWIGSAAAGAISGALLAPKTVAGARGSGAVMGLATYWLAVPVAAIALALPRVPADPSLLVAWVAIAAIGASFTGPLVIVCLVGGVLWSALVRRLVVAGPRTEPATGGPFEASALALIAGATFIYGVAGWAFLIATLAGPVGAD